MTSQSAIQLLEAAATKVERGWTQAFWARSGDGRACPVDHPAACAWCAQGAVWATEPHDDGHAADLAARAATLVASRRMGTEEQPYWDMILYNEDRDATQTAVASLLREAAHLLTEYPGLALLPPTPGTAIHLGWVEEILALAKGCAAP